MNRKKYIKIGLGETVITPNENLQMHGFGRSQVATGVHDDLHSRCLIVEDNTGTKFVLVSISIVEINDTAIAERIRIAVVEAINVSRESVLISCTHTHSGPEVSIAPMEYQDFLVSQIAESAKLAMGNLAPGRIGVGKTVQLEVGKNRRRLLYGGMHPDPELVVLRIEDISGNLRGVLFNYGCHPATLDWKNRLYSEDWPYYAIKGIKEKVGSDIWVCFLQAAQGDINTGYDSLLSGIGADMPVRDYAYIEYKGKQMAETVLEVLPKIKTETLLDVEIKNAQCNLPLRNEFPVSLQEAKDILEIAEKKLKDIENNPAYKGSKKLDKFRTEVLSATQTLDLAKDFYSGELKESELTELQVFRVGSIVFFSLPGEIFSEIALEIKKGASFTNLLPVGLANCRWAYMPTEEEFIDGDYEVDGSKYSPKAGAELIKSLTEVINSLKLKEII